MDGLALTLDELNKMISEMLYLLKGMIEGGHKSGQLDMLCHTWLNQHELTAAVISQKRLRPFVVGASRAAQ